MIGKSKTKRSHLKYFRLSDEALDALELLKSDLDPYYAVLGSNSSYAASISILLEWYKRERPLSLLDNKKKIFLNNITDREVF